MALETPAQRSMRALPTTQQMKDYRMSEAFSAFVSYLECSETGEQYPANQAYNVSNAGYPYRSIRSRALETRLNRERRPQIAGFFCYSKTIAPRAVRAACLLVKSARHRFRRLLMR